MQVNALVPDYCQLPVALKVIQTWELTCNILMYIQFITLQTFQFFSNCCQNSVNVLLFLEQLPYCEAYSRQHFTEKMAY